MSYQQKDAFETTSELLSSEHGENLRFLDLRNTVTADSSGITSIVKT